VGAVPQGQRGRKAAAGARSPQRGVQLRLVSPRFPCARSCAGRLASFWAALTGHSRGGGEKQPMETQQEPEAGRVRRSRRACSVAMAQRQFPSSSALAALSWQSLALSTPENFEGKVTNFRQTEIMLRVAARHNLANLRLLLQKSHRPAPLS